MPDDKDEVEQNDTLLRCIEEGRPFPDDIVHEIRDDVLRKLGLRNTARQYFTDSACVNNSAPVDRMLQPRRLFSARRLRVYIPLAIAATCATVAIGLVWYSGITGRNAIIQTQDAELARMVGNLADLEGRISKLTSEMARAKIDYQSEIDSLLIENDQLVAYCVQTSEELKQLSGVLLARAQKHFAAAAGQPKVGMASATTATSGLLTDATLTDGKQIPVRASAPLMPMAGAIELPQYGPVGVTISILANSRLSGLLMNSSAKDVPEKSSGQKGRP